jgi:tetratricopeptide (TPR) repeat protein
MLVEQPRAASDALKAEYFAAGPSNDAGRSIDGGDSSGQLHTASPPPTFGFYHGVQRRAASVQKRHVEKIEVPRHILVDYLAGGYGYDLPSIERALQMGNVHFKARELKQAVDFFGVAYELARMHCVYPPLMHDLLLRRVLCFSMLGDLKAALVEADFALQAVPNSILVSIVKAVIFAKIDACDDATVLFQETVTKSRNLRDFVDCMVALFTSAKGHAPSAINICSEVLRRAPRDAFALLVRSDAYKFHPSGMYAREASEDYAAVVVQDRSLAPFLGNRPADVVSASHGRVDELLLRFHPLVEASAPRCFADYPVYSRRTFLHVSALVLYAIARLRTLVRSSKLVRCVWRQHEALLQQRAAAEHRMALLMETQRKIASMESHSEVWGPADPDNRSVQKYRRYWMERPFDFPSRKEREGVMPVVQSSEPPTPLPSPADRLDSITTSPRARAENREVDAECDALKARVSDIITSKSVHPSNAGHLATLRASASPIDASGGPKAPPLKIGAEWDEKQWAAKAFELVAGFKVGVEGQVDFDCKPTFQLPVPPEPRAAVAPLSQPLVGNGRRTSYTNLVETIFEHGFGALPVWYDAVDQVFEVTRMTRCKASPEAPVASAGLAGTPRHSYVVTKGRHLRSRGPDVSFMDQVVGEYVGAATAGVDDDSPDAATVQRYQNRLLGVSLGGGQLAPTLHPQPHAP